MRVFVGNDERGRPKQVSRTVRGTKRDAQRAAAELTVAPPATSDGRTVADALDACTETHTPVKVGSMLVAGNSQAKAVVRVVAIDDDGQVHFSILPAPIDMNRHLLDRDVRG